jgi:hypothetical protein
MTIEEAIGRLKVVDSDEPQALSGRITIDGKLHLTREKWEACQGDKKTGESSSTWGANAASRARRAEVPKLGREDKLRVVPAEARKAAASATRSRHEMMAVTIVACLATGPGNVDNHDAARPTSHRRRRMLCS